MIGIVSHVALCWEMGSGMGHLLPLAVIAAQMRERGVKVSIIASDLTHAHRYLGHLDVCWLQAPRAPSPKLPPLLVNHADVLIASGYDDESRLLGLLHAWRSLFRLLDVDLVICEYAPTALLAARTLNLRRKYLDNGFSVPPISNPIRAVRDDIAHTTASLLASEKKALDTINAAMDALGAASLPAFASIYREETWYRNWVEFNHFGPHSPERHVGQIVVDSDGADPVWPKGSGEKLFAYLKGDFSRSVTLLHAAIEEGYRVLASVPHLSPQNAELLRATGRIHISDRPVRLSALGDDVAVGVWHSPTGGVGHSLDKGMRMLFLPGQFEQQLAARAVRNAGLPAYVCGVPEPWPLVFERVRAMPAVRFGERWKPADVGLLTELLLR